MADADTIQRDGRYSDRLARGHPGLIIDSDSGKPDNRHNHKPYRRPSGQCQSHRKPGRYVNDSIVPSLLRVPGTRRNRHTSEETRGRSIVWMQQKRLFRGSLLLALALLVPLFSLPLAHASTFLGYTSSNFTGSCGGNCADPGSNTDGVGQSFNSPLTGQLAAVSFFTGNELPNKVVILTATLNGNPSTTSYGCAGGATCYFIPDNTNQFAVQDVETLTGLSANTYTTVSLGGPVSVNTAQWVAVILMRTSGTLIAGMLDLCTTSCGSNAGSSAIEPGVMVNIGFHFGTSNPSGNYLTAGGSAGTADFIVGASFNPSSSGGQTVTVTQCYGNCGNPAITLANTNSTHTVNFNQTITLFYMFQSNVNGFLLNVTTSMAKSYLAIPNGPAFRVYTIQSCPLGQAPFSPKCTGLLQAKSPEQSTYSPLKGKIYFS